MNRQSPDSIAGGTTFEYQRTIERELETKATEVLERIVGSGRAVVRVRAKIDFSREERTEELFDPEAQVVRSEESLNEVRQNGGNRVGGAAGAQPNDPNVAQGVVRVGDAAIRIVRRSEPITKSTKWSSGFEVRPLLLND